MKKQISFEKYGSDYNDQEIKVIGFLKYEYVKLSNTGIYDNVYSMVDDFDNQIILTKLSNRQKLLFRRGIVTSALFEVTGTFKVSDSGKELKVSDINEAKRPIKVIEETITKEKIV